MKEILNICQPDTIPDELKAKPQWVCWKSQPRSNGHASKIPVDPKTGQNASHSDPSTWSSFDSALEYYKKQKDNGIAGIGFVFSKDDPFVGVDLDDCRDPETGDLANWAADIIQSLNSYAEVSPSRRGIKIFTKGQLPGSGRNFGNVEMYDRNRFFTITGWCSGALPTMIENRNREIKFLYKEKAASFFSVTCNSEISRVLMNPTMRGHCAYLSILVAQSVTIVDPAVSTFQNALNN